MATGNYFQGNSVFAFLSSVFGNPTSGNTAASVPVSTSFVTKAEDFLKKQVFGIPLWIIIAVVVAILVIVMVVM